MTHRSFWPPPELLSGPVRNQNCFVLLFRVAMVIANVTGSRGFGCRQFGMRRKGLYETFGLWNCVLR
ncbi:uncharacterized protein DS421_11g329030 [Arachis hypogaea]|nr:uncharacterized protein DS421_11g329030 [Arachis hypogaea]